MTASEPEDSGNHDDDARYRFSRGEPPEGHWRNSQPGPARLQVNRFRSGRRRTWSPAPGHGLTDENTGYSIKFRISGLPHAPGRRPASAELVKRV